MMRGELAATVDARGGDVRVWYWATDSLDEQAVRDCEAPLSDEESARGARFRFWPDRRDFVAAHALLRRTLSRYGPLPSRAWRFQANSYGKPAIAGSNPAGLTFNLSHTRGCVACVVARGLDVGIDVEPIDGTRPHRDIARRFFSDTECRDLDACPRLEFPRRFVELWTLKEAYIKALGTGLSCPLEAFSFTFVGDAGIHFDPGAAGFSDEWQFALAAPQSTVRLAVAVRRRAPDRRYTIVLQDADGVDPTAISWARQSL